MASNIFSGIKSYKFVLLGESAVGKSSLVLRFVKDQFDPHQRFTVGAAYLTKTFCVNDTNVNLEIWDTAGQERFHSLAPMYYRGAQAAMVVYDIREQNSFGRAKMWIKEIKRHAPSEIVIALVGNKIDLALDRAIDPEEARQYSNENGLLFMETSAKTAVNVQEVFSLIVKKLFENEDNGNNKDLRLGKNEERRKFISCCSK